jgi:hypothetical protein
VENPFLNVLALLALVLLVAVTGGVGYLTLADWRDRAERSTAGNRRRREEEKRQIRRDSPKGR